MDKQETTEQGLVDALLAGDISTDEFLKMSEEFEVEPEQKESELDEVRGYTCPRCGEVGVVPGREGKCPHCGHQLVAPGEQAAVGAPARAAAPPRGLGRGLGIGRGRGPLGVPAGIRPGFAGAESLKSFETMVSEACKMKRHGKKTKKPKQKESLQEYAAPEWREVAMWARGQEVKRNSERQPYYFQEDRMFSRKKLIAVRDLNEKKAKVLSPKVLDAYSGRHSVLAQHGLRSCGFQVEVVDSLDG